MKFILFISLMANLSLGYLYWKETSKPRIERTIIESHPETKVVEKKVFVKIPHTGNQIQLDKKSTDAPTPMVEFDQKSYEQIVEKVSADRETYLQETLAVEPEVMEKIDKVKKKFFKEADKLILGSGMQEPTIEQRRQLLNLEEAREKEFSRSMGEKKWQKFKSFRDEYNRKNYKRQMEEHTLFIPMEI
jgi:hypothetical protein